MLASEVQNYGMSCAGDLQKKLSDLIFDNVITHVVETGTYLGTGTTNGVLEGFMRHGLDYHFISIEVNPDYHRQAMANNVGTSVQFWNGLSIPKKMLPTDVTYDVPDHILIDHDPSTRNAAYSKEVSFNVKDDLLRKAFKKSPELVILDSAGHLGFIEFKYTMELLSGHTFYLCLDDIGHIKHYHSMQVVLEHPEVFEIVWRSDSNNLHQSAIIKVKS